VLLLTGQKKTGTLAATAGAALLVADQFETLKTWWEALPGYIEQVQEILEEVQESVDEVAAKRERLVKILS
jgi:hypothetical protein